MDFAILGVNVDHQYLESHHVLYGLEAQIYLD